MGYKYKQKQDLAKGKWYEQLFCDLTGATMGSFNEDVNQHTDVWLDGASVDVKGLKRSHKKGNVLLEFLNVQGKPGWCSPDGADKVAFLFKDGFYILNNEDLYLKWCRKIYDACQGKIIRKNGIKSEDKLYKLIGRRGRKDVFTYLKKSDLTGEEYQFWAR